MKNTFAILCLALVLFACKEKKSRPPVEDIRVDAPTRFDKYIPVTLTADLSHLSSNQKKMLAKLIDAASLMDTIFWIEAWPNMNKELYNNLPLSTQEFVDLNYGPWDRLEENIPFVDGVGRKPSGANFYPIDMSRLEFNRHPDSCKNSPYTLLRRDEEGTLYCQWYHEAFAPYVNEAATLLEEAADLAESEDFANYLRLRAKALRTDDYTASDVAWLTMEDNDVDIIIGPIENYEDQKYGIKTAHEAYVLVKDKEWSQRLEKYAALLPDLQENLPVPAAYKAERPGGNAQLNAYDVVFYAGDCNAGSKTIAVNLPNDEELQLKYGTRRSQLKNAMRAKYDEILLPIAEVLIAEDQLDHITFDAFFENTMFHEVAHGLGIKNTINGMGTVREALLEQHSALEEGKADILGLFMITQLHEMGEFEGKDLMDNYVTFLASIFRSVRFGASSAHGKANMLRFNYFKENGAFQKDSLDGTYRVDFEGMKEAMNSLSNLILTLQGNGDYDGVKSLMNKMGSRGKDLRADIARVSNQGIPVDIYFEQGNEVLGLRE